jgi:hypothetical protein
MPHIAELLDDAVSLPWKLHTGELPSFLLVEDQNVLDEYDEKAGAVWDDVVDRLGGQHTPDDLQFMAMFILAIRIFAARPAERDDSLRAAFEACWRPEYREDVMAAGASDLIWRREHADCFHAAKQGDPVASAMMHMMDVLQKEGGGKPPRMAMAGDTPAILWEDLLRTVDARTGAEADALLVELVEEGFATWIGDKPYVLINSLIWSAPKMVKRLSRNPREKVAIDKAGGEIFSAILNKHPEAWNKLGDLVKSVVEEDGIDALQEAEAEALTTIGPDPSGTPVMVVTEAEDGEVGVYRVRRPQN